MDLQDQSCALKESKACRSMLVSLLATLGKLNKHGTVIDLCPLLASLYINIKMPVVYLLSMDNQETYLSIACI